MSLKKEISGGERVPIGYAIAYLDYVRDYAICYPLVLHWIIKWGRITYFRLFSYERTGIDKMFAEQYQRGFEAGLNQKAKSEPTGEFQRGYHYAFSLLRAELDKREQMIKEKLDEEELVAKQS